MARGAIAVTGGFGAGAFGLAIDFGAAEVVVRVRGAVDLATAPHLAGVLDAALAATPDRLVVDLAALDFIDVSGLRTIVAAANTVMQTGGTLGVRAAPPAARRIFTVSGLADLLEAEMSLGASHLGPEQPPDEARRPVPSEAVGAAAGLRTLGTTLGTDLFVNAALRLVVALAAASIGSADGVSVSLSRNGALATVAASDDTVAQMDRDQYATGQGPCVAASREGRWFHIESLANEPRWPDFIPRAVAGGIASILSTPLFAADRPVGALNIYSNAEAAFRPEDWELAALFATQASGILTDARADGVTEEGGRRLGDALRSRELIAQAQGIVMERDGDSPDAAFVALRHLAATRATTLSGVAAEVVASTQQREPNSSRSEA